MTESLELHKVAQFIFFLDFFWTQICISVTSAHWLRFCLENKCNPSFPWESPQIFKNNHPVLQKLPFPNETCLILLTIFYRTFHTTYNLDNFLLNTLPLDSVTWNSTCKPETVIPVRDWLVYILQWNNQYPYLSL